MKPFDPTKPVQARDGRKARIICTDASNPKYPIVAMVTTDGNENPASYTKEGLIISNCLNNGDLINIPIKHKREVWVNVYPTTDVSGFFNTRQAADRYSFNDRIACIKLNIEFEEGEGL